MERYSVLLGWNNEYCKNGHTTQSTLQIQCNTYQITHDIFTKLEQTIQKFIWTHRIPKIAKAIIRNKTKKSSRHNSPRFQAILQNHINRNSVAQAQNRHTDQWSRIENPEINPDTFGQLIFDKGGQNIKLEKRQSIQQEFLGNLDSCMQINDTRTQYTLTPCMKINSK